MLLSHPHHRSPPTPSRRPLPRLTIHVAPSPSNSMHTLEAVCGWSVGGEIWSSRRIRKPAPTSAFWGHGVSGCVTGGGEHMGGGGGGNVKRQSEQVRRMGNKQNKKGKFAEALGLYNRAISMAPDTRCDGAARRRRSSGTSGCRRRWWSASWPLGWSVVRACAHERLTFLLRKRWFSFFFVVSVLFFTVCCFWRQFHKCGAITLTIVRASPISLAADLFRSSCSRLLPLSG